MNPNTNSTVVRTIAIVAIILIGGGALAYSILGKKTTASAIVVTHSTDAVAPQQPTSATPASIPSPVTTPTPTPTPAPAPTPKPSTSTYKDGTYSATGSYLSPGGNEKIGVTVTLKGDVITSASVTPEPVSAVGKRFQSIFAQNFQPLVVGKKISDVNLSHVSGSSLTPGGFNDALAQIKTQAHA